MMSIILFTCLLGNGPFPVLKAFAATLQIPAKGVTTYQQFMKLAHSTPQANRTPVRQLTKPTTKAALASTQSKKKSIAKILPSVQPAKMKPMCLSFPPTVLSANQAGTPLTQIGSDQHLEVQVTPDTLNVTNARLVNGAVPA